VKNTITLLTDFGTADTCAAQMKGAILGINPNAVIVDISHEVEAHQLEQAAFLLDTAFDHFPEGTVHVVVVDPGVGTERRGLAGALGGRFVVCPDNGVITLVWERCPGHLVSLTNQQFWRRLSCLCLRRSLADDSTGSAAGST